MHNFPSFPSTFFLLQFLNYFLPTILCPWSSSLSIVAKIIRLQILMPPLLRLHLAKCFFQLVEYLSQNLGSSNLQFFSITNWPCRKGQYLLTRGTFSSQFLQTYKVKIFNFYKIGIFWHILPCFHTIILAFFCIAMQILGLHNLMQSIDIQSQLKMWIVCKFFLTTFITQSMMNHSLDLKLLLFTSFDLCLANTLALDC